MNDHDNEESPLPEGAMQTATEIAIRLGAVVLLVLWSLRIIAPFVDIVVWAVVIAIAVAPTHRRTSQWLGGRRSAAATLLVIVALFALIVPAIALSETLISGASALADRISSGEARIPPPPDWVATWPLVGESLDNSWRRASENLAATLAPLQPQLQTYALHSLSAVSAAGLGLLQILVSLVLSGVLLAQGEERQMAVQRLSRRLAGDRGAALADLATATIRAVVQGIIGVAAIQSVLAGLGFLAVSLPAAGLWALLVLMAAIVQFPVALIVIPPVAIVYSTAGTTVFAAFAIWSLAVSLLDNFLKPVLFGRGLDIPAAVIFVGAIGGMLAMGILGLFLGAVVLAVGYQVFVEWLGESEEPTQAT